MQKRICRQAVLGLIAVVVTATASIVPAHADSAVDRAMDELNQIQEQAAQIDAAYAEAQVAFESADAQLKQIDADIATQTVKVDSLKDNLAQLALAQYQVSGVGMAASLLASADEDTFLSSLVTIDSISEQTNSRLQDVQVEQAKLDRLRADAETQTERRKAEQDKQAELVKQFDAKEAEAKAVTDRLKEDERAKLEAARQERARAAEEAASRSAATTRPATPKSTPSAESGAGLSFGGGSSGGSSRAQAAVDWARAQIGRPYRLGSAGPDLFDCSGLTSSAYKSVGVALPRTSQTQFGVGTPVDRSDLRPGDLLFFYGGITHVGMYVGDGVMVHSSPSGHGVHFSNLATYPSYQGARRVA